MKFTNAYELNLFLYKKGLIEGLYLGLRGEFEIETKINDNKLLKILHEIWGNWRWGESEEELNATYGGFYNLKLNSNDELTMDISINDDIRDFHGIPFDIEEILRIISKHLSLENVDNHDFLELQICLNMELDYENLNKKVYQSPIFSIKGYENDTQLKLELLNKTKKQELDKTKELVVDYLVLTHKKHHGSSYEGFFLTIEDNYFSGYMGTGHEKVKGLRRFLESQLLEIDIDVNSYK